MKRITHNLLVGECFGISQQVIEAIVAAAEGCKLTMSLNLGGTNNHRKYVIVGPTDKLDEIERIWSSYCN